MRGNILNNKAGSKKYVTVNDGTKCSCIKRLAEVSDLIRPIAHCYTKLNWKHHNTEIEWLAVKANAFLIKILISCTRL